MKKSKGSRRDRAKLLTQHLPIKEGPVGGAEGVGDGWWCTGSSVAKVQFSSVQGIFS